MAKVQLQVSWSLNDSLDDQLLHVAFTKSDVPWQGTLELQSSVIFDPEDHRG